MFVMSRARLEMKSLPLPHKFTSFNHFLRGRYVKYHCVVPRAILWVVREKARKTVVELKFCTSDDLRHPHRYSLYSKWDVFTLRENLNVCVLVLQCVPAACSSTMTGLHWRRAQWQKGRGYSQKPTPTSRQCVTQLMPTATRQLGPS